MRRAQLVLCLSVCGLNVDIVPPLRCECRPLARAVGSLDTEMDDGGFCCGSPHDMGNEVK